MEVLNSSDQMLETVGEMPIGTGKLAFRDLPIMLKAHVNGNKALDFGCGAGRSSRFLQSLGYEVLGVDISGDLIKSAKEKSSGIRYLEIDKSFKKCIDEKFDLVFVSFVLMEISSKKEVISLLSEISQLLSPNGRIVVITGSDYLYKKNWLSIDTKFPENISPTSGDIVKVYLKDYDTHIYDYFWSKSDYLHMYDESGLIVLEEHAPLGCGEDKKDWIDEYDFSPFSIFVLKRVGER